MHRVKIIAEAGVNHNGSLELALRLIDAAAEAGADVIKFQTFKASKIVAAYAHKADYQVKTTGDSGSQLDMLKRLELSAEDHLVLKEHCAGRNIEFLSTPFDLDSVDFLSSLGVSSMKIPSGEITNLPYLRKVAATGKDIILSTGMCSLGEVEAALEALEQAGADSGRVVLLHCTTEYPAPLDEVNLRAMLTFRSAFPQIGGVGYSDHTVGIEVPIAAVALGACLIEKHFTLDKSMEGPDHKASLNPAELKSMVAAIRNIERALGDGRKSPTKSERANRSVARKSIVAARDIACGELLTEDNLTCKRPGTGRSPMLWDTVVGTRAERDYRSDEQI